MSKPNEIPKANAWSMLERIMFQKNPEEKAPLKIVVSNRGGDFHARLENGKAAIWGRGNTRVEAIGNLVDSHGGAFNVVVEEEK